jgi:L-ascorbate metabolism protein UlaG (beta-lactamase superfamily)
MKTKPKKLDYLFDIFSIKNGKEQKFKDLFTQDTPKPYSKYNGDKVRMRYFGHACILVETEDISVLVDPLISYYGYQSDINRFSDQDLPEKIDFALITHNHQDHILLETLLPLRHRIDTLVIPAGGSGSMEDPNLKLIFLALGFKNVIELQELDSVTFGNTTISGLPFMGEHCDLNIRTKLCYHLTIGRFSMLFVADSCILEPDLYKHVHKITGDIDVIFLGMECDGAPLSWLYGPLLFKPLSRENDQSRRLAGSNFQRGMDLVDVFNPKEIYVYAMGMEPWLTFISSIKYTDQSNPIIASNKLIDTCRSRGIIAERLFGEKELYYSC